MTVQKNVISVPIQQFYTYNTVQVEQSFPKLSFFTYFEDGRSERRTP